MCGTITIIATNPLFLLVFCPGLYEMGAQPLGQSAEPSVWYK